MSQIATPADKITLFSARATQGNSPDFRIFGGQYLLSIQSVGVIGTTTVQIQYKSEDGLSYYNLGAARTSLDSGNTPPGGFLMYIGVGTVIRAQILTADPASPMYVTLARVPL